MDYGGEGEEGHLQQRKCRQEMRDQERGDVKSSGAILGGNELNDPRGCGLTNENKMARH